MNWEMLGWGGVGFLFMVIWWLIPVALVALVVYLLVRGSGGSGAPQSQQSMAAGDPALRILRERFARGEIDVEEFRRMRAELEGRP